MLDDTERWLPVVGYEGSYEVSSEGRVRSLDRLVTDRIRTRRLSGRLRCLKMGRHYWELTLSRGGVQRTHHVHQLVCEAFHGRRPKGAVVRHLNGQHTDNRPENLRWGTPKENTADMIRHGNAYWTNQTHCKWRHEFTEGNTRIGRTATGVRRNCRECDRIRSIPEHKRRSQRRRANRHTLVCEICAAVFRNAIPRTRFCSSDCRRISRRKEFGWMPKPQRRAAA